LELSPIVVYKFSLLEITPTKEKILIFPLILIEVAYYLALNGGAIKNYITHLTQK